MRLPMRLNTPLLKVFSVFYFSAFVDLAAAHALSIRVEYINIIPRTVPVLSFPFRAIMLF